MKINLTRAEQPSLEPEDVAKNKQIRLWWESVTRHSSFKEIRALVKSKRKFDPTSIQSAPFAQAHVGGYTAGFDHYEEVLTDLFDDSENSSEFIQEHDTDLDNRIQS